MKTRLQFMTEFREATLDYITQLQIEIEHGTRMVTFLEEQEKTEAAEASAKAGKEKYDSEKALKPLQAQIKNIGMEVARKQVELTNRNKALEILEDMILEQEKKDAPVKGENVPAEVKAE